VDGVLGHYRALLGAPPSTESAFESVGAEEGPDLSNGGIKDRVDNTAGELHRIVKDYLGDAPAKHQLVDELVKRGDSALRMLRDEDETLARQPGILGDLEAIVRTDGSRPSFTVREGVVDKSSSPLGNWESTLDDSREHLEAAIACVGRIDDPGTPEGYVGTGFLIQENLIVTNRHVLQAIAARDDKKVWRFNPGVRIDFGHEFRGRDSLAPRELRKVVFAGPDTISFPPVVHSRLDLVLIELAPAAGRPPRTCPFDIAPDWASPGQIVYTIGYPANPGTDYVPSLLEQLFQSTYGCKRVAPGKIEPGQVPTYAWTLAHDATTLGGNSGSIVVALGREQNAAGLHYGGRRGEPRENWGHVLGKVLDVADPSTGKTLLQALKGSGVVLVDRAGGPVR
jgi:hypothetical protein